MSNTTDDLTLYLKLDEIDIQDQQSTKVHDSSGNGHEGIVQGATLVPDDMFGSCLSFDGEESYVDGGNGFSPGGSPWTVSLWFKCSRTEGENILYNKDGLYEAAIRDGYFHYAWRPHWDWDGNNEFPVEPGTWYHTAVVYDSQKQYIYKNGEPVFSRAQAGIIGENGSNLLVGARVVGSDPKKQYFFKGQMAHLRIYRRALSAEEIMRDMTEDQTAFASFRKSHPLAFNLFDDDQHAVLYIDDAHHPAGHNLYLEISNTSPQKIELAAPGDGTASQDNHHFELRFRPGTLSKAALKQVALTPNGWVMSKPTTINGTVSLYFLNTQQNQQDRTVNPDETITLLLQCVSAAAGGGARGTRVELKPHQLTYVGDITPITGSREQHLSIVNHQGRRHIPLHVGFVGSNTILNDGSAENALTLRITNTLKLDPYYPEKSSISLRGKDKYGDKASQLILSFDVQAEGEQNEWALGTTSQVNDIQVSVEGWNIEKETEGESPEWILTPNKTVTLKAGEYIQITLSEIISSLPSGYTNLYLHYENIAGYWDGQFVCPIEKAPILYRGSNVGIGTTEPKSALAVSGGAAIGAGYAGEKSAPENGLLVEGEVQAKSFKGDGTVPKGVIVMWSGKVDEIPDGWALCDGKNGTPNLTDRFIMGTSEIDIEEANRTGGTSEHSHSDQGHTHPNPKVNVKENSVGISSHVLHKHGKVASQYVHLGFNGYVSIDDHKFHSHGVSVTLDDPNKASVTIDESCHLPPYYKLAFIIKL